MNKRILLTLSCALLLLLGPLLTRAQGVTSGSITGVVSADTPPAGLPGVTVLAEHLPSGTKYYTATQADGRYYLPNVRIGGPYRVTASFVGYQSVVVQDLTVKLGEQNLLNLTMGNASLALAEIHVTATHSTTPRPEKMGASKNLGMEALRNLPSINRSISDFTRTLPQATQNGFLGKGNKSNFITVDGSAFNNSFGLGGDAQGLPGNNTGAEPISLDAIEQVQVSVSPYDVRQAGFTGASINAVTRSGDNEFRGSVYTFFRNESLIGTRVKDLDLTKVAFSQNTAGFRLGGPIIKDKLFFFGNYERVRRTDPASLFTAARPGQPAGGNVSRITAGDLNALSSFMNQRYGYQTGPYEAYNLATDNDKFLLKLDWNVSTANKLSLRYSQLTALQEQSPGNGPTAMTFQNTTSTRNNEIKSLVGELNSTLRPNLTNRLFASYTTFPEFRTYRGSLLPAVIITEAGNTTRLGTDQVANNNKVEQKFLQLQNDLTLQLNRHTLTAGISYELLRFSNTFTPNWQGAFTFNSLADFYNSSPAGTTTPLGRSTGAGRPAIYQRNYSALPSGELPTVRPEFSQLGVYLQDEYALSDRLRLTGGLRADVTSFLSTPLDNPAVAAFPFQDASGNPETYHTGQKPGTKVLFSPRVGFNWDVIGDRSFQVRGGTGVFTGRAPFVYIEKQYSDNGLLQGQVDARGTATAAFPFNPNPNAPGYGGTGGLPASYQLSFVKPTFKMPQIWRTTLGLDHQLPAGIVASLELVYSKDLTAAYIRNANFDYASATTATDSRLRFANSRVNAPVTGAYVFDNTSLGSQYNISLQLEKQLTKQWFASLAYAYGRARSIFDFGSTTTNGAFGANPVVGNSNQPPLTYSDFDQPHRVVGTVAYQAKYATWASSTLSFFGEAYQRGRFSYTYQGNGDVNGDRVTSNDLLFVPASLAQINLQPYTNSAGQPVTVEQQWTALDNFISGSDYLSSRRGQFAERNGAILPWAFQLDMKFLQDFYFKVGQKTNTLQLSADVLNLTNLLSRNWGTLQLPTNTRPIEATSATTFRVNPDNIRSEFVANTGLDSRWRVQFGVRYSFN